MCLATALLVVLISSSPDAGTCAPAPPAAVALAEKKALDADHKASQAESIAVRSGNPGAQARANQARAEATAAQRELARMRCQPAATGDTGPAPTPAPPRY